MSDPQGMMSWADRREGETRPQWRRRLKAAWKGRRNPDSKGKIEQALDLLGRERVEKDELREDDPADPGSLEDGDASA